MDRVKSGPLGLGRAGPGIRGLGKNCHPYPNGYDEEAYTYIYGPQDLGRGTRKFPPIYSNILITSSFFSSNLSDLIIGDLVAGTILVIFTSSFLHLFLQDFGQLSFWRSFNWRFWYHQNWLKGHTSWTYCGIRVKIKSLSKFNLPLF